ncbi:MAG: glycosyltransferase [Acidimicrobiales bacterium]
MNVLYISYDGALDPLGHSQVIPYLERLSALGHRFDLVTFEKPSRFADQGIRLPIAQRLATAGIRWHPLRYHKRVSPVATSYDLARGSLKVRRLAQARDFDLVHARSYPSALLAWQLSRRVGVPFVFDMRGLYPAERVDGGLWPAGGALFRATTALERRFLRDAAAVVTLTRASLPTVQQMVADAGGVAPVEVIPTCVDLAHFQPAEAPAAPFVLAYAGSIGTWYLLEEMLRFGAAVLEYAEGRMLFLVNGSPEPVRSCARAAGLAIDRLDVRTVKHHEVPAAIGVASATCAFIRATRAGIARAPTKLSESLALGLPAAVNRGIGDAADIVEREGVGVVVDPFDASSFPGAARQLVDLARDPSVRRRCRAVATRLFDLDAGVRRYGELYEAAARSRRSPAGRR